MKLFIGGLPFATTEDDLREAFSEYGEVTYVKIITDRDTGRSRGFGFVEYGTDEDGNKAIAGMDGKELGGRTIHVSVARERDSR